MLSHVIDSSCFGAFPTCVQTFMSEDVVAQWSAIMGQSMEPPTTHTSSLVIRSVS